MDQFHFHDFHTFWVGRGGSIRGKKPEAIEKLALLGIMPIFIPAVQIQTPLNIKIYYFYHHCCCAVGKGREGWTTKSSYNYNNECYLFSAVMQLIM